METGGIETSDELLEEVIAGSTLSWSCSVEPIMRIETSPPAPAPPPPQLTAMQERMENEARSQASSREREVQQAVAARRQEVAKAAAGAPAAAISRSVAESASVTDSALNVARLHADPDDWLEHIRQLRRDGQQEAADREWKQFQETYPDHPVAETDLVRP